MGSAYLAKPSSCRVGVLLGRVGALPKRRRRGCLGCRRLTRPSLAGSQSRLGTSSWLGSRQHSSTKPSSGSLAGPSSRPTERGPGHYTEAFPGSYFVTHVAPTTASLGLCPQTSQL